MMVRSAIRDSGTRAPLSPVVLHQTTPAIGDPGAALCARSGARSSAWIEHRTSNTECPRGARALSAVAVPWSPPDPETAGVWTPEDAVCRAAFRVSTLPSRRLSEDHPSLPLSLLASRPANCGSAVLSRPARHSGKSELTGDGSPPSPKGRSGSTAAIRRPLTQRAQAHRALRVVAGIGCIRSISASRERITVGWGPEIPGNGRGVSGLYVCLEAA